MYLPKIIMEQLNRFFLMNFSYQSRMNPDFVEWTAFSDDIEDVFTRKELEKAPLLEPAQFIPPPTWNETQLEGDQEQLVLGSMQRIADKVSSFLYGIALLV